MRKHLRRTIEATSHVHFYRGECAAWRMLALVPQRSAGQCLVSAWVLAEQESVEKNDRSPARNVSDIVAKRVFSQARRLLKVVVWEAISRHRAADMKAELARARHAETDHRRKEEQLRGVLGRQIPGLRATAATLTASGPDHDVVRRLLKHVRRDYARPLLLYEIADELNVNADYLSALFRKEVGVRFKWYQAVLRLQRAQELLSQSTLRISEVAREVGYGSPRRFRAAFHSWTGLAPSRWRQTLKVS